MEPAKSTRLDIVRTALDDIVARLTEATPSEVVRDLRRQAARYERMVVAWQTTAPSEEERSRVMREVLELEMTVMKLGG